MGIARSRGKLKTYINYHNVYCYQTLQGGHLSWEALKLNNPLIAWSCEITIQTKNISPLLQCLWQPTLAGWWLTLRGTYLAILVAIRIVIVEICFPFDTWPHVITCLKDYDILLVEVPRGKLPSCHVWWLLV